MEGAAGSGGKDGRGVPPPEEERKELGREPERGLGQSTA